MNTKNTSGGYGNIQSSSIPMPFNEEEVNAGFAGYNLDDRQRLPIEEKANEVLYAIEKHDTTIVIGETGSGKSTKLPQLLLATGRYAKRIGLTMPKRVSVISVAKRIAQGSQIGAEVGYAVRFDR